MLKVKGVDPARRQWLQTLGRWGLGATALGGLPGTLWADEAPPMVELPFANGQRPLVAYPQKRPLILLTSRPPQLETPFSVFNESLYTPNDAFFVRYHWSEVPTHVDLQTYRLQVGGHVKTPLSLSLEKLQALGTAVELPAVHQCSGNSRGKMMPRVNGGQAYSGLMGNARWEGLPLKTLLEAAGVKAGAVQVSFDGLDHPPLQQSPDFVKALDIDHALDGEVMVAWRMNGAALPLLNGYPLRLVVPGYYGTYWVKHLSSIQVLEKPFEGFWMEHAYRVPEDACHCLSPDDTAKTSVPIARFDVRSFITSLADGDRIQKGRTYTVRGIAFDGGYGITEVAFSADGGQRWQDATLGRDVGRYAFREWTVPFRAEHSGEYRLLVRAVNRIGQTQPQQALWNPGGYMYNATEHVRVVAG